MTSVRLSLIPRRRPSRLALLAVLALLVAQTAASGRARAGLAPSGGPTAGASRAPAQASIQPLMPSTQLAYLKPANTDPGDLFGTSVAIDGDTVVVGAPDEASRARGINGDQNDNLAPGSGAVYIFVRSSAQGAPAWRQQAYLKAANADGGDRFGSSVAISGDTLVVGAAQEDSAATGVGGDQGNNAAPSAGAAYVFVRENGVWTQQAYLKASNAQAEDGFGESVAIDGATIVVGTHSEASAATGVNGDQADNSAQYAGAAYVFVRAGTAWSQQAYLKASNTAAWDWFGASVAIAGETIVVGAPLEDSAATGAGGNQADNSAAESGAAYVFVRSGATWAQQSYLKASNTETQDLFGGAVGIAGDTLAAGATQEDSAATGVGGDQADNAAEDSGAAYVFGRSGAQGAPIWTQQAYLKAAVAVPAARFARSVAADGLVVLAGAPGAEPGAGQPGGAGAAYGFGWNGAAWRPQAALAAANADPGDRFGATVALSGELVVAGAPGEDSRTTRIDGNAADNSAASAGAAYLFASNALPAALAGPDLLARTGDAVTLDGRASSDPAGELPLSYAWTQTGGPAVTLTGATSPTAAFQAPSASTVLTFSLTVTNAAGVASAPDQVAVTVRASVVALPLVSRPAPPASCWNPQPCATDLYDIEMLSATDGWAVGGGGLILRWDGQKWRPVASPVTENLSTIDMVSPTLGWAAGRNRVLRWNGQSWQIDPFAFPGIISDLAMLSANDGWLAAHTSVWHWDGATWTKTLEHAGLYELAALSATEVWVSGVPTYRWDGSRWNMLAEGNPILAFYRLHIFGSGEVWHSGYGCITEYCAISAVFGRWAGGGWSEVMPWGSQETILYALGGTSSNDVWTGGDCGCVFHWNGQRIQQHTIRPETIVYGLSAVAPEDAWLVGSGGAIAHWDGVNWTPYEP